VRVLSAAVREERGERRKQKREQRTEKMGQRGQYHSAAEEPPLQFPQCTRPFRRGDESDVTTGVVGSTMLLKLSQCACPFRMGHESNIATRVSMLCDVDVILL
jgi:hypothetical protein